MKLKKIQYMGMRLSIVCSMLLTHESTYATNHPLTLQEVINIALKENVGIQIAEETRKEMLYANRGRIANLWIPTATFGIVDTIYTWDTTPRNLPLTPSLFLTATIKPLSLETLLVTKLSHHGIRLAGLIKKKSVRKILEEVVACYYSLAIAQKTIELSNLFIKTSADRLQLAETQFRLGRARKIDCLDAKVALQEAKLTLLEQKNALKEARQQLNIALGNQKTSPLSVQSAISLKPIWNIAAINNKTMVDLDRATLESRLNMADTQLTQAKTSLLSTISLSASFQSEGHAYYSKDRRWYDIQTPSVSSTMKLTVGIDQLLLLPIKVKEASIQLSKAKLALMKHTLMEENNLADRKAIYHHNLAAYKLEEEKLKLSKQKLAVKKERYRLNQITLLDLQEEEKATYKTEIQLLNKAASVKKIEFEIYQLAGLLDL